MNTVIKVIITTAALLLAACGPSKAELGRLELLAQEQARIAAEQAQKEATTRKKRMNSRLQGADLHWSNKDYLSEKNVQSLFSSQDKRFAGLTNEELEQQNTYFINYPLQAARYDYKKGFHPFRIVGIRSLPNSGPYSSLFPDEAADYAPGQSAKSVVEFALHQDLEKNRLGQDVLMKNGHRWVATVLNFKNYPALKPYNRNWQWIPGVFEDIKWNASPEKTHAQSDGRNLEVQLGLRFCTLEDRCYSNIDYQGHPTHAVRAEVMSIYVGNRESGEILAKFVREAE
ncbi:MAG: hypothetical protein KBT75_06590 [Oleispira antarctica]|uniref:Lipoprotein n=1 Tax=Oleispira antarctica RB-8 TaxID=698738 RepID=R4YT44_OLEAN|nr:hypothetical protein [Oleispira antarctica]MBQ0791918.1 hypothetical protein [Oleispira antarctica]CCK76698.1 hypothetical protein OLEAN_C25220 [Oleispira antarctica RB-8]